MKASQLLTLWSVVIPVLMSSGAARVILSIGFYGLIIIIAGGAVATLLMILAASRQKMGPLWWIIWAALTAAAVYAYLRFID